ncbi:ADP-dependent phosphofructokinase/glucokinase [Lachnospiraceae bacterium PM6-15]|uniref:ADP-dependent glucokinase/phosphofructokinase n=1 Tax=Ohessyouella blattaphilus TaxID=2949333 RepID=UPI003E21E536
MEEKIAVGFHTCVDYELKWSTQVVEAQIRALNIREEELCMDIEADSERGIWIACLAHLRAGIGCEIMPATSKMCEDFANHFEYRVTLGGTPTRAAIILDRMGYKSMLQTSCYNKYVEELMPKNIRVLPGGLENYHVIYPHVVLQCSGGVHIKANDIDFVTPRENRLLISRDEDSLNMAVLVEEYGEMIKECQVFLLGSFSEIIDYDILKDRMEKTRRLLSYLPKDAIVIMEDGHYVKSAFRHYVHQQLASRIDILSMNEDEMQQYTGESINILDAEAVRRALEYIYRNTGVPKILVHSSVWALVYGKDAASLRVSLEGGVMMAGTRFRLGDDFTMDDYEGTKNLLDKAEGVAFCKEMRELLGNEIYCIPCKDLSDVKDPTVVGLGDTFAGGLLPGLLKDN